MIIIITALFAASYVGLVCLALYLGRCLVRANDANVGRINDLQNRLAAHTWGEYAQLTAVNTPAPAPSAEDTLEQNILDNYSLQHSLEGR